MDEGLDRAADRVDWILVIAGLIVVMAMAGQSVKGRMGAAEAAPLLWPAEVQRYTRVGGYLTVPSGESCYEAAGRLVPQASAQERWLVGQELAAINNLRAGRVPHGQQRLRVPIYRPYHGARSCYATVDLRTWHVCVMAGMRYGVRPSLLVGIRVHEGGNRPSPRAPWGCKPYGSYGLRDEAMMAARIVRRHADRYGWDAWAPTRGRCDRLGGYYTTGRWAASNEHWGACVWAIMRRAEGA